MCAGLAGEGGDSQPENVVMAAGIDGFKGGLVRFMVDRSIMPPRQDIQRQ